MFSDYQHKRLFNDNDDLVTTQIIQGINRHLDKRTCDLQLKYEFDFHQEKNLSNNNYKWQQTSSPRLIQRIHKQFQIDSSNQENESYNECDQKKLTYVESYKLFQEHEEDFEIAEEAAIHIPNESDKSNLEDYKEFKPEFCDSPSNRLTLQIYPDNSALQYQQQNQINRHSIRSSINSRQSMQCSVTQSLRLSCISYLETRSTMAEEEDFSQEESKIIKLLAMNKCMSKIFEEDEDVPSHKNKLITEHKERLLEEKQLNQVFDAWLQYNSFQS